MAEANNRVIQATRKRFDCSGDGGGGNINMAALNVLNEVE